VNLSKSGAQINFQVKGNWISAKSPMVLRSIPLVLNQAGKRLIKMNNGSPEVNPVKTHISIFLEKISCHLIWASAIYSYFDTNL
jgi:hypothetical protein